VQNDPLWKLRHALAGVGLALLLSVPIAAVVGSALGDALGGTYGWRAGVYGMLLLYVVVGAFVLFAKVARHETRPLSMQRVGLWLMSLWLWPLLLLWTRPATNAAPATVTPPAEAAAAKAQEVPSSSSSSSTPAPEATTGGNGPPAPPREAGSSPPPGPPSL